MDASDDVLVPRSLVSKSKLREMVEKANPVLMDAELGEGEGVDAGGVTMKVCGRPRRLSILCRTHCTGANLQL